MLKCYKGKNRIMQHLRKAILSADLIADPSFKVEAVKRSAISKTLAAKKRKSDNLYLYHVCTNPYNTQINSI